jgi:ABC-type branched-subunit amino acid transport system ATPase component
VSADPNHPEEPSGVTVRRYGQTIILEPQEPLSRGGSVTVAPSFWADLLAAVDVLWHRTAVKTRGEAALAMVRAGIAIEDAVEPALGASRLLQRQLDLARGLAADPAGIVLRGFFDRLNAPNAATFMAVLREVAARGVACYIVAGNAREAELAARAVRLVFTPALPFGRRGIGGLGLGLA